MFEENFFKIITGVKYVTKLLTFLCDAKTSSLLDMCSWKHLAPPLKNQRLMQGEPF